MRKFYISSLLLVILAAGVYLFRSPPSTNYWTHQQCPFCDSKILNYQKFYEDDLVLALYTHKPVVSGHCLIIPKRHVERFDALNSEEMAQMGAVIKKVDKAVSRQFGTSSYLLLQKNGMEVGQSVPHVHFHYVPKKVGECSRLKFVLQMFIADQKKPISQEKMHQVVRLMHEGMEKN